VTLATAGIPQPLGVTRLGQWYDRPLNW